MILSFHKKRKPHVEWLPRLDEPPAEEPKKKTRKPHKNGDALRDRIARYIRERGRASLTELSKNFGGQSTVVGVLLTMAEDGRIAVLNNDWFGLPEN